LKKKVLIVDESELARDIVTTILDACGYDVASAPPGRALKESLEREAPDIVLFDEVAPARGAQLVELAGRVLPKACALVLFADRPDAELAQLASMTRATYFIRKVGDPGVLARHVERLLEKA
jgi:DNA-binding NtrC family response regulator